MPGAGSGSGAGAGPVAAERFDLDTFRHHHGLSEPLAPDAVRVFVSDRGMIHPFSALAPVEREEVEDRARLTASRSKHAAIRCS